MAGTTTAVKPKIKRTLPDWFHYIFMLLPGYAWLFMFSIVPMTGIVMAFQDFAPKKGWFGSPMAGMKHFEYLFSLGDFQRALWNTLIIAVSKVILNIIIPLTFALLLNEVKNMKFKKGVQTIVYLPHFISWVLLGNIISNLLGSKGILNLIITSCGGEPILLMEQASTFQALLVGTDVWKEFGYNAVVYLAALTGIDLALYEAAAIDGANRWQQTWHITLPGVIQTVVLLTTLAMGNILNAGFDQVFNMYNQMVIEVADILDTYVYRLGIVKLQFSLATAAGLFKSVVSFALVVSSYGLAYKFADYTIF